MGFKEEMKKEGEIKAFLIVLGSLALSMLIGGCIAYLQEILRLAYYG